jgi:hypothetical protein
MMVHPEIHRALARERQALLIAQAGGPSLRSFARRLADALRIGRRARPLPAPREKSVIVIEETAG